jgi:uncharacterized C2H2 Zn-finger protein
MLDSLVKVHNKNTYDYKENFKGKEIFIPAGKSIKMDYEEAHRFLGQMPEFKRTKDGNQDPTSYKWLEMDKDDRRRVELALRNETEEKSTKVFCCHACGEDFDDKKSLFKHVKKEHYGQLDKESRKEIEEKGDHET